MTSAMTSNSQVTVSGLIVTPALLQPTANILLYLLQLLTDQACDPQGISLVQHEGNGIIWPYMSSLVPREETGNEVALSGTLD